MNLCVPACSIGARRIPADNSKDENSGGQNQQRETSRKQKYVAGEASMSASSTEQKRQPKPCDKQRSACEQENDKSPKISGADESSQSLLRHERELHTVYDGED
jgi:hypothetical protein